MFEFYHFEKLGFPEIPQLYGRILKGHAFMGSPETVTPNLKISSVSGSSGTGLKKKLNRHEKSSIGIKTIKRYKKLKCFREIERERERASERAREGGREGGRDRERNREREVMAGSACGLTPDGRKEGRKEERGGA